MASTTLGNEEFGKRKMETEEVRGDQEIIKKSSITAFKEHVLGAVKSVMTKVPGGNKVLNKFSSLYDSYQKGKEQIKENTVKKMNLLLEKKSLSSGSKIADINELEKAYVSSVQNTTQLKELAEQDKETRPVEWSEGTDTMTTKEDVVQFLKQASLEISYRIAVTKDAERLMRNQGQSKEIQQERKEYADRQDTRDGVYMSKLGEIQKMLSEGVDIQLISQRAISLKNEMMLDYVKMRPIVSEKVKDIRNSEQIINDAKKSLLDELKLNQKKGIITVTPHL